MAVKLDEYFSLALMQSSCTMAMFVALFETLLHGVGSRPGSHLRAALNKYSALKMFNVKPT